ncbi:MAG TPA: carbohydrate ABC transporter permease [Acetobacteraceae bacterium]|jgi:multiple sugar transport system permease protein
MSIAFAQDLPAPRPRYRGRGRLATAAAVVLGIALLIWTLLPVYNMVLIALDPEGSEFTGSIWPPDPNFDSFRSLWTQDYWRIMNHFWPQFANSIYMGAATTVLTVLIGSLTSFALGRLRLRKGWLLSDVALLTYALPAPLLALPFLHIMHAYGLSDNLWAVIAAEVAFATPYAILILHQYGKLIPMELDEAAKIDGASPLQVYLRIYVPLMAPALVAIGIYALLLAWNEYIYQYMMLSSPDQMTVAAALDQFFVTDESPWNYMMAIALVYSLPPIIAYVALRRYLVAGLTLGGIKG